MLAQGLRDALEHELAEHRRLLELAVPERVAAGISWSPLKAEDVERAGRGRSRVLLRAPSAAALHEGLESGDRVIVGPIGSPDSGAEGRLLAVAGDSAEVLTDGPFEDERELAVTRQVDRRTFDRYLQALDRADSAKSPLLDVLLGRKPASPLAAITPRHEALAQLNDSQRKAAEIALRCGELALIHGPPGTGKTQTIIAILRFLASEQRHAWALADSNAAVDHLTLRAAAAGLDVVRLGHPARITSAVAPLTIGERMKGGPAGAALEDLDKAISATWRENTRESRDERKRLIGQRDAAARQARRSILENCEIVASTLGTLARFASELPQAEVAIVDEATQAVEPAALVPAPFVGRMILVGDPKQLGPVVKQAGNPLERSLLQRLLEPGAGPELPLPMLSVQHRMNAKIESLVDEVYDDALSAHPSVADALLRDLEGVGSTELTATPLLWVDTAGAGFDEERDELTRSLYCEGEIRVVAQATVQLLKAGVPPASIGVVAPYSAQVSRLRALPELEGVEVASVNAFQGREKEAIVCSFVRSNVEGELGFVADERRLTVALTRARRLLLCVGDSATLSSSDRFARVLESFQAADAWASVFEEPWSESLD
jgi:superfamily I DNA and/or RNA helicase